MKDPVAVVAEENCSGCLICALACSFFNTPERVFNPSRAYIQVERKSGENEFRVRFQPECLHCGICKDYCPYGVLGAA